MIRSRSPLLRFGFVLQTILVFAMQMADGSGVHRCPDHDSGLGVLAMGSAPSAPAHHAGHHHGEHDRHGACPCLGACHSASVALAPGGTASLTVLPALLVACDLAPVVSFLPAHPRRLPYAIGPPSSVPFDIA